MPKFRFGQRIKKVRGANTDVGNNIGSTAVVLNPNAVARGFPTYTVKVRLDVAAYNLAGERVRIGYIEPECWEPVTDDDNSSTLSHEVNAPEEFEHA